MPNPDGLDQPGRYQHIRENATDRYGYLWLSKMRRGVPSSGTYRIRVRAQAIDRRHPYQDWIIDTATQDPLQMSIVAADASAGDMATNNPTDRELARFEVADDQPQWYEATIPLDAGYTPRLGFPNGPAKIKYMRHALMRNHRDLFPRFLSNHVHVFATMHPDYDPVEGPKLAAAFVELQEDLKAQGKPHDTFGVAHRMHTDEAWTQFYAEYRGPRLRIFEIELDGPIDDDQPNEADAFFPATLSDDAEAEDLIRRFADRAYRRPVCEPQLKPMIGLYRSSVADGDRITALRTAYQAILCSPAFLYLQTRPGPLDDFALASRLSFFLWDCPPDAELRTLAERGRLSDPNVLANQADRMIADPRFERFVDNLIDGWLHLDKLGTMLPDRVEHPDYYNQQLESAMRNETRLFILDAIRRNRSASVLIDDDETFLNAPLARMYGIADFDDDAANRYAMRRVRINDPRRGGLLGQAAVLTASANGIDTSPVLRGVWVLECLFGTPPSPPPPDVEPIEPDIRGTTTIREQLDRHRDVATCRNCHSRIDPPGFALEVFDEVGKYRTHYAVPGKPDRRTSPIDASGQLRSGESFDDIVSLKRLLLKRVDAVAINAAKKMMILACGRVADPADAAEIHAMVSQPSTAPSEADPSGADPRMGDLLKSVILSESFRR